MPLRTRDVRRGRELSRGVRAIPEGDDGADCIVGVDSAVAGFGWRNFSPCGARGAFGIGKIHHSHRRLRAVFVVAAAAWVAVAVCGLCGFRCSSGDRSCIRRPANSSRRSGAA